jgi:hypothetical protein
MSNENESKQKTAAELLEAFSLILDTTFYQDLVHKWGTQYRPTQVTLSEEEVGNLHKLGSFEMFYEDVKALREFYEVIVSLSGVPEDFNYIYKYNHLNSLKEEITKETPIKDSAQITAVVEEVLSTCELSKSYYIFTEDDEDSEDEASYPILSQNEVDSLLNAVPSVEPEPRCRKGLKSDLGMDQSALRLEYEFYYLYALAKKGVLFEGLFQKRAFALALFSKAYDNVKRLFN